MKKKSLFMFLMVVALMTVQCTNDEICDSVEFAEKSGKLMYGPKATGSVNVFWESGGQKNEIVGRADYQQALFQFDAHEEMNERDPKGEILLQVFEDGIVLHREIKATVKDVLIDPVQKKAWFTGIVYYDSKSHEDDLCDHEDGGCSHDDGEECSHDDGEECGGSDGSCSHDEGEGCDGGCSHDDEEPCEGGSEGGSGKLSGKNNRVGQLIAVKVHDGSTPGEDEDGITWRWFSSDGSFVPSIENISQWPHLCKKTIVEGNLVIHNR